MNWYSINFSPEKVFRGKTVEFLRFRNNSDYRGNERIWIFAIPEIINIDINDDSYAGQVFFNGADVFEIAKILKGQSPRIAGINYQDFPVLIYGGPENPQNGERDFYTNLRLSPLIGLENGSFVNWIEQPLHGEDNEAKFTSKFEKYNFRIDYKGEKHLVVKITFILTTADATSNSFYDLKETPLPVIGNRPGGIPKKGDVKLENNEWFYFNGTDWVSLFNEAGKHPVYGIKHLHEKNMFLPHTQWDGPFVDYLETYIFCYPENDKKTSRDKKYWINKPLFDKKYHIYNDTASFLLLRTNPKLSGNIKLVVEKTGNVFLDTIEANDELANAKYKKKPVSTTGSYWADIRQYFSDLPPEILYDIKEKDKLYLNSKKEFIDQYDFFYGYGASQLLSKYYDENFKLFAPLWLKRQLPDYFVIFKAKGPLNKESFLSKNKEKLLRDLTESAEIVETFDMRKGTVLGDYIRKIIEDERFREQPLQISYEKENLSTYFGISYKEGILCEKGEFLYDFFAEDHAINDFEEFITSGFERNGLICANLLNLEFLFDDDDAEPYDINRYFGLYLNEIELAQIELFNKGFDYIENQLPKPVKNTDAEPYTLREFKQKNNEGIIIPARCINGKLPPQESVRDSFRFFYLKGRDGKFFRVKDLPHFEIGKPGSKNYVSFDGVRLNKTAVNISNFSGISKMTGQFDAEIEGPGNAQLVIDFSENCKILDGEIFEIEWDSVNKNKQIWKCIANSNGLQPGDAWDYPVYDPSISAYVNNFSPQGTPEQVAAAFASCLNKFENKIFTAYVEGTRVYLSGKGEASNNLCFRRVPVRGSQVNAISFYGIFPKFEGIYTEKEFTGAGEKENLIFIKDLTKTHCNEYEVEILETKNNILKILIKRNGGKLGIYNIVTGDVETEYKDIVIKNNLQLRFKNAASYTKGDKWKFYLKNIVFEQKFIGGTARNGARAKVRIESIKNIDPSHWYQNGKNSYSRLATWDVQGEKIYKLAYLDRPVYEGSLIKGYKDLNTHAIIQIENNKFYSTNGKIVSYDTFKPSVGIFSFFPVKNFDFDWHFSDYAYLPNIEIFKFYEIFEINSKEKTKELPLYNSFKITKGKIRLQGRDKVTKKWEDLRINDKFVEFDANGKNVFNTFLPAYEYKTTYETNKKNANNNNIENYFFRNYIILKELEKYDKIRAIAPEGNAQIEIFPYIQDKNLKEFRGFLGLQDFFSYEDEEELEKLVEKNDIDRFFYGQLLSEYDRLRENFNKNYAVKSRVVPFINKWVQTGTDCRDNKYRLNNSMAFGLNNFSPDPEIKEKNPRLFTHEFYYIDNCPSVDSGELLKNTRGYFFERLTEIAYDGNSWYDLFKRNDNDWFSKYFTVGYPNEIDVNGNKIRKKTEERYIFTKFVPGDDSVQGLFRGCKFKIKHLDNAGNEIKASKKYENYKFAAILRIQKFNAGETEPPAKYEFIANDKFKTIVFIVTLYVSDYRIADNDYGYLFLYSGTDALKATDIYAPADNNFERYFNALQGGQIIQYADVKLSGIFNTKTSLNNPNYRILTAISLTDKTFIPLREIFPVNGNDYSLENYFGNKPFIKPLENGEYSEFSQYMPGYPENIPLNYIVNNQPGYEQKIVIDTANVILSGRLNLPYVTVGTTDNNIGFPTAKSNALHSFVPNENYKNASCWYLSGGKEYLEKRLEEISYAEIFQKVNSGSPAVKYFEVTDNGLQPGNFRFEFIDFDRIEKVSRFIVTEDSEKPEEFHDTGIIGFETEKIKDPEVIFRHRGLFEPKTRDVLYFWLREDEKMTEHYEKDFMLLNTRWNVEFDDFGFIKNLYFNKIAKDSVLKISKNSKFKSLYPLVNEIAIDKKDYFIFSSNWDNDYYNFYENRFGTNKLQQINTTPVGIEGTNELREQKSFFGSKLMNLPKKFEFDTFLPEEAYYEIINISQNIDIEHLSKNKTRQDNKPKILIHLDLGKRLLREMVEQGAAKEFLKLKEQGITRFANMTDNEILEEAKKYLFYNILPLYRITDIVLYVKENAEKENDEILKINLNKLQKREQNYKPTKNVTTKETGFLNYTLEQTLDSTKYNSFSISAKIERV